MTFSSSADQLIARANRGITKRGGTFEGDTERGKFEAKTPMGPVIGSYTVQDNRIRFMVEKKPMLLPCAAIEKVLTDFLAR